VNHGILRGKNGPPAALSTVFRIAAVILAAGRSSRMGTHKALLSLGRQTVLERVVQVFISAGISDIRIVTGHDRISLEPVISRLPVYEVINPRYQDGMYSSVRCGVISLDPEVAGFFIHPVDIPLISSRTIRILMNTPGFDRDHIVSPEFEGRHGHPPLIGASFRDTLLTAPPPSGLAGFLQEQKDAIITVQVQDPGIRMNMNTPEDYKHILDLIRQPASDRGEDE